MYMFVEPHLPNDMFPYTCIMTLPLWKTIIVGISLQAQKCTYMIICTVPNISLHTYYHCTSIDYSVLCE